MCDLAARARDLVDSDRHYFGLGAQASRLGPFEMLVVPELAHLPAACVAWWRPEPAVADPAPWLTRLMDSLDALGARLARVYVEGDDPALAVLGRHGYRSRTEIGFFDGSGPPDVAPAGVELVPLTDDAGWAERARLADDADASPDGHAGGGRALAELERIKCATGEMASHLVVHRGSPVGSVASLEVGRLLRVKNLYVAPEVRRRGVGRATLALLGRSARSLGLEGIGVFGVAGTAGSRLYAEAGFTPVTQLREWSAPVGPEAATSDDRLAVVELEQPQ